MAKLKPRKSSDKKTKNNVGMHDSRGKFAPGNPGGPGRPKGHVNKIPTILLEAIVSACEAVGYTRNCEIKDAKGKVTGWAEEKRIKGLVPYIQQYAEENRDGMMDIVKQIIAPAVANMQVNIGDGPSGGPGGNTREQLEAKLAQMGVSISLFHGDPGREPKMINYYEDGE